MNREKAVEEIIHGQIKLFEKLSDIEKLLNSIQRTLERQSVKPSPKGIFAKSRSKNNIWRT